MREPGDRVGGDGSVGDGFIVGTATGLKGPRCNGYRAGGSAGFDVGREVRRVIGIGIDAGIDFHKGAGIASNSDRITGALDDRASDAFAGPDATAAGAQAPPLFGMNDGDGENDDDEKLDGEKSGRDVMDGRSERWISMTRIDASGIDEEVRTAGRNCVTY